MPGKYVTVKSILKILDDTLSNPEVRHPGRVFRNALKRLPAIDAVEVVRCECCEHYKDFNAIEGVCRLSGSLKCSDDFCSDAEKK